MVLSKVACRAIEKADVVTEIAERHIAALAEKTADLTSLMVMIDGKKLQPTCARFSLWQIANGALVVLLLKHLLFPFYGKIRSVHSPEI